MQITPTTLTRFIQAYEQNGTSGEVSTAAQQFADAFVAAGPNGAQCVRNVDFAAALPKRKQLFEQLGYQSSELIDIQESWFDTRYALVKTRWRFLFRSPSDEIEAIEAASSFLVDTGREPFQILLYLAHQDLIEILKERRRAEGA